MAIVVPFEAPDGSIKRGWFKVTNSRAGDVVIKACAPPPPYVKAATRIIMKLADGEEVTRSEKVGVMLLAALWMIASNRVVNQVQGFKLIKEILGDDPVEITEDLREAALRDLGLYEKKETSTAGGGVGTSMRSSSESAATSSPKL